MGLGNLRTKSKPSDRDLDFEKDEQTLQTRLDNLRTQGANRSSKTGEFENKEYTVRKNMKIWEHTEQTARMRRGHVRTGSKPLLRDCII